MCNRLYNAMMSYARESEDSVSFYTELAGKRPDRTDYYLSEAHKAQKRVEFYRAWAAEELESVGPSERSRTWEDMNLRHVEAAE